MAAAGLTHGGFYRHFDSRNQIVVEACTAAMESLVVQLAAEVSRKSPQRGLKAIVKATFPLRTGTSPQVAARSPRLAGRLTELTKGHAPRRRRLYSSWWESSPLNSAKLGRMLRGDEHWQQRRQ
jgi:TetR/AcrR family transcriptional repressor of nem operon